MASMAGPFAFPRTGAQMRLYAVSCLRVQRPLESADWACWIDSLFSNCFVKFRVLANENLYIQTWTLLVGVLQQCSYHREEYVRWERRYVSDDIGNPREVSFTNNRPRKDQPSRANLEDRRELHFVQSGARCDREGI